MMLRLASEDVEDGGTGRMGEAKACRPCETWRRPDRGVRREDHMAGGWLAPILSRPFDELALSSFLRHPVFCAAK